MQKERYICHTVFQYNIKLLLKISCWIAYSASLVDMNVFCSNQILHCKHLLVYSLVMHCHILHIGICNRERTAGTRVEQFSQLRCHWDTRKQLVIFVMLVVVNYFIFFHVCNCLCLAVPRSVWYLQSKYNLCLGLCIVFSVLQWSARLWVLAVLQFRNLWCCLQSLIILGMMNIHVGTVVWAKAMCIYHSGAAIFRQKMNPWI